MSGPQLENIQWWGKNIQGGQNYTKYKINNSENFMRERAPPLVAGLTNVFIATSYFLQFYLHLVRKGLCQMADFHMGPFQLPIV